jgi:glutathione S-transferase
LRPHRYSDDPETHDAIRTNGRETIDKFFEFIEEKLKGIHAVGDTFTAVDAYLLVIYKWGSETGIDMQVKYPKYITLVKEALKRDPVQATIKEAQIIFLV